MHDAPRRIAFAQPVDGDMRIGTRSDDAAATASRVNPAAHVARGPEECELSCRFGRDRWCGSIGFSRGGSRWWWCGGRAYRTCVVESLVGSGNLNGWRKRSPRLGTRRLTSLRRKRWSANCVCWLCLRVLGDWPRGQAREREETPVSRTTYASRSSPQTSQHDSQPRNPAKASRGRSPRRAPRLAPRRMHPHLTSMPARVLMLTYILDF